MNITNLRRLGLTALLASVLAVLPAVSAQPSVPPYNRDEPPGEPPAVPGFDKDKAEDSDKKDRSEDLEKDAPEVEGRGPVHEGFAAPADAPRPGVVVPKAPPALIEEVPPEQKPEGDNIVWIPGYWAWDEDRRDFLWVSGAWRAVPAGRKWVPGYWAKTDRGHQWVSGFWAPAKQQELPYVPDEPPDSLDRGPSTPPPDEGYEYVPGNWLFQEDRFVWKPGFWYRPRPGLVWCPPRWVWTPGGYLYVSGFWDVPLEDRGILCAPVYFPSPIWRRPGFVFRPVYVVPPAVLIASLWIRPGAGYYAYGDFYAARYARAGYRPWAVYGPRLRDPLFGYYRWANRGNPGWQRDLVTTYRGRVNGDVAVPPRTLAAQERLAVRNRAVPTSLEVARPITRFQSENFRVVRQNQEQRAVERKQVEAVRQTVTRRVDNETRAVPRGRPRQPLALDKVPTPVNRQTQTPRQRNTPRNQETPRLTPAPRNAPPPALKAPPRDTPPAPKRVEPAPRNNPPAVPRVTPRVDTPPPAPRNAPPSRKVDPVPEKRPNLTPAPRTNPPPALSPSPKKVDPAPRNNPPPRKVEPVPEKRAVPNVVPAPRNGPPPPNPQPRNNPPPAPKRVEPAPRNNPPPAPKQVAPAPRSNPAPAPRQVAPPPVSPPSNPAPVVRSAPRVNPPPAPRVNPAPAPRVNPAPAVRPAPPPPRMSPPPRQAPPPQRHAPPPQQNRKGK